MEASCSIQTSQTPINYNQFIESNGNETLVGTYDYAFRTVNFVPVDDVVFVVVNRSLAT